MIPLQTTRMSLGRTTLEPPGFCLLHAFLHLFQNIFCRFRGRNAGSKLQPKAFGPRTRRGRQRSDVGWMLRRSTGPRRTATKRGRREKQLIRAACASTATISARYTYSIDLGSSRLSSRSHSGLTARSPRLSQLNEDLVKNTVRKRAANVPRHVFWSVSNATCLQL